MTMTELNPLTNQFIGPVNLVPLVPPPTNSWWLALVAWLGLIVFAVLCIYLLPKFQTYLQGVKPVVVDGMIITLLSGFVFSQMSFSTEECYKYVNAFVLFWVKYGFGLGAAMLTGLKAFRSTEYASHIQEQKNGSPIAPPIPPVAS